MLCLDVVLFTWQVPAIISNFTKCIFFKNSSIGKLSFRADDASVTEQIKQGKFKLLIPLPRYVVK